MLDPHTRGVLLTALRPPEGYALDRVLATTYSLDLTALLTVPLAFSMFDAVASPASKGGGALPDRVDPLSLLRAVRDHSGRIAVFCQATRITNPPRYRRLLTYLEGSVVQVEAPDDGGVFHPKMWAVRYGAEDGSVAYRVLCLSRNLTFDRSWDTMLVLDGELTDRTNAIAANHPLADFFAALPGLARGGVGPAIAESVVRVAEELRRVKFEIPGEFEAMRFHPMGIDRYRKSPFTERIQRLLVVSPFVNAGGLRPLISQGKDHVLLSRVEELDALDVETLDAFSSLHLLHDGAEDEPDAVVELSAPREELPPSSGLHAKVYVADDGRDAHVWTGSANATEAAFHRNVEFLVQLTGKRARVGVEATLHSGLETLLAGYSRRSEPVVKSDEQRAVEERLRRVRQALGRVRWVARVGAPEGEQYPFSLHARGDGVVFVDGEVETWPITLEERHARNVHLGPPGIAADFGRRSFDAITTFFAFRVRIDEAGAHTEETFVIAAPLEGAPEDRSARVLQSLLDDPAKVMRFLRLLLADDPLDVLQAEGELEAVAAGEPGEGGASDSEPALLEVLLRALDRDPARVDAVEQLVAELSTTESGRRSLTPELLAVWEPIRDARAQLRARGGA